MAEGITIDQLAEMCKKQQALGNGKKMVLMSSDDEGNDYHHVWEGLTDGKELAGFICGYQMCNCTSKNPKDFVFLT
jgi:hypothetical protein